jgi:hypothetical protein
MIRLYDPDVLESTQWHFRSRMRAPIFSRGSSTDDAWWRHFRLKDSIIGGNPYFCHVKSGSHATSGHAQWYILHYSKKKARWPVARAHTITSGHVTFDHLISSHVIFGDVTSCSSPEIWLEPCWYTTQSGSSRKYHRFSRPPFKKCIMLLWQLFGMWGMYEYCAGRKLYCFRVGGW